MEEHAIQQNVEKRIGALVRASRLAADLTQAGLGERIGVSYQQIQKYETGANRISVSTIFRIAGALGMTASEIVQELERT